MIPLGFILLGIIYMLIGLRRLIPGFFKRAFIFFLLGSFFTLFLNIILEANQGKHLLSDDADNVFVYSVYTLAVFSGLGFIYDYFNSFLPMIFIRLSLILSIFSFGLGIYVSISKAAPPKILQEESGNFREVKP